MGRLKPGFGRLATLGEAFDLLFEHVPRLGPEKIAPTDALGRVVAKRTSSEIDVPHFVKAAMDGFAVRAEDTFGATQAAPKTLRVTGSVMPGELADLALAPEECAEIGTGAPIPEGADAVVMVEYTESGPEDTVVVSKGVAPRENLVEIGSDVSAGEEILPDGTRIEPRHLGVMAACGIEWLEVKRKPVVALFSTGPELVAAGGELEPGRIFDINFHTLRGALVTDGCRVIEMGIVPDEAGPLDEAIAEATRSADLLVLSGGSSLGGGDLVDDAFSRAGELVLHGVAVKPGKPLVLGTAVGPDVETGKEVTKLLIGLPGYPMSALSDYYIFVRPLLQRALGVESRSSTTRATLRQKHASTVGRYEFLPVRLEGDEALTLGKGSSAISALAGADGFVEIDENTEVLQAGAEVSVRLF